MADQFNLGSLTKEMIVSRLRGAPNAPVAAAEIAKKTIIKGVQGTRASGQSPRESVQEICHGMVEGMVLIEGDLVQASVLLLQGMAEVANELSVDPPELMTWAMEGIAKIAPVTTSDTVYKIGEAIEQNFQGAGEVFAGLAKAQSGKAT